MKHLLLTLALFSAAFIPSARALDSLPYFGSLRAEVLNQLNIATNGVPEPDKKLVSALRKALTTIDKTKPDYASGAKALGTLAKGLNRTTVSNEFAAKFYSTVGNYVAGLLINASTLSNRLASTYPSKSHTAAENSLAQLDAALDGALAASDVIAAAKFLSTAAKNRSTAEKNVVKAEDAPAPPAQIVANVSGALNSSIQTQGATITGLPAQFNLLGGSGSASGQKTIQFSLQNVTEGTHVVNVIGGAFLITSATPATYTGGTGTATLTYKSASHSLFGTFTYIANGTGLSTGTVTVSGSFTVSTP